MEILNNILMGYTLQDVKQILILEGHMVKTPALRYVIESKLQSGEYRKNSAGKLIIYDSGLNVLRTYYEMKQRGKK